MTGEVTNFIAKITHITTVMSFSIAIKIHKMFRNAFSRLTSIYNTSNFSQNVVIDVIMIRARVRLANSE